MDVRAGLDHGSAATGHRWVDKRSAVHQQRRGIRWTALPLVYPTAGTMINACALARHRRIGDGHREYDVPSRSA